MQTSGDSTDMTMTHVRDLRCLGYRTDQIAEIQRVMALPTATVTLRQSTELFATPPHETMHHES